jgi:diguanylate cyclase (GGDEF)-like protein/PAS domain S-box-containing protein
MTAESAELVDDRKRVEALIGLDILDTPEEQEFDELVQLASEICDTPISLVSLVDKDRQWFKASVGLAAKETPRSVSFCSHAIQKPELFIVENAATDARFRNNSLVTGAPNIRFYAGIPLHAPNGYAVGTLCVIDTEPRTLTKSQRDALTILGRQVKARMELRQKQKSLEDTMRVNKQLMEALSDRNNLFSAFMNNGPFISFIKDEEGRFVYYNELLSKQFGVDGDSWIGRKDADLFPPEMAQSYREHDLKVLRRECPVELAEVTPGPEGTVIHWRSYKFPFQRENGDLMLAGMSIDVTEELARKAELDRALQEKFELAKSLESSTILMRTFVNNNPNVCFFKSEDGRYLSYNSKFAEHFGIDEQEWIGKLDREVLSPEMAESVRALDIKILEQDGVYELSRQTQNAKGETVWHKSFKFPIRTADGSKILASVAIDITREMERERALSEANQLLEQMATTDALTGLSNRRVFEDRIASEFSAATRTGCGLALICMDIDNFKKRNDTYGHAAGDEALRMLGHILLEQIRKEDIAARVGGEEFVILMPHADPEAARLLAERIQVCLRGANCGKQPLTVSIGIATVLPAIRNWEQLISVADNAMYEAKRTGKDRIVLSPGCEQPIEAIVH